MEPNDLCTILLKFGGYWVAVKGENRMKYAGGSQKTLKFTRSEINLIFLKDKIESCCHWLRGQDYELHYHISGTSPKLYMAIRDDEDIVVMTSNSFNGRKIELVVIVKELDEGVNIVHDNSNGEMQDLGSILLDTEYVVDDLPEDVFTSQVDETQSLFIGSRFEDASTFKHAIRSNVILQNFAIKIQASNKSRVIVTCKYRGCPWRVRASLCADGHSFEVRKMNSMHLCPGVNRAGNKQASACWIANEIKDIVKRNPDITPKDVGNNLETKFGLSLSYMKVWRARELARQHIFGSIDDNYKWVPTLKSELINRNPGSHISYLCDKNNEFKRFFVSFKVSIDGFFTGCRYLIGVDACHLKSKYLGVLLSANCLDGNNGLFTLAFAVAESESKRSWEWFLRNLAQAFGIDVPHVAFISDMEKGLGEAIKLVFPGVEHRVCMRHLWKNMKKLFRCDDSHTLKKLVWTTANCYNMHEFDSNMEEMSYKSPEVHSYLNSLTYKWSKATFSHLTKNHYNTNNMSESFNAWVEEARSKPVVDLIDMLRAMIMEQRLNRKINSNSWKGPLVPCVDDYIRDVTTRKEHFIIRHSTTTKAEIEGNFARYEVDTEHHLCSCGYWQISGLPCVHAAAFLGSKQHTLWHTYVDESYYVFRYRMTYEGAIATLPGKEQWTINHNDNTLVLPPLTLRPRGRPKKRRIRSFLEGGKKSKTSHKCGRCNSWGHHKSTCKEPINFAVEDVQPEAIGKIPIRRAD